MAELFRRSWYLRNIDFDFIVLYFQKYTPLWEKKTFIESIAGIVLTLRDSTYICVYKFIAIVRIGMPNGFTKNRPSIYYT